MAFLQKVFKAVTPKPAPVPEQLPKITAPKAAQIAERFDPSPRAKALLNPQQTPSQFLGALQDRDMGEDMVKTIAHGLPEREGISWAVQSAERVSERLPAADVQAMRAAQAWLKNPTPANKAAAAAAADQTDYCGPGAWAAQAVAWSQSEDASRGQGPGKVAQPLASQAVASAVLLAATIKAKPALAPNFREHHHPFILLGFNVATGTAS